MRVLSLRLHPHAEPALKCPRAQQSVFDQAPGVLPVRRETIEGIGCCRMPCVHPAGVQCGTRCKAETCRGGHCMQRPAMRSACQALRCSCLFLLLFFSRLFPSVKACCTAPSLNPNKTTQKNNASPKRPQFFLGRDLIWDCLFYFGICLFY